MLIFMVGAFFFTLARSLEFQDTAMHMFMTGIGVSSSPEPTFDNITLN